MSAGELEPRGWWQSVGRGTREGLGAWGSPRAVAPPAPCKHRGRTKRFLCAPKGQVPLLASVGSGEAAPEPEDSPHAKRAGRKEAAARHGQHQLTGTWLLSISTGLWGHQEELAAGKIQPSVEQGKFHPCHLQGWNWGRLLG